MSIIWDDNAQGTEAWMRARSGRITGSRAKDARDRSNGLTKQQQKYVDAVRAGKTTAEAMAIAGYKAEPRSDDVSKAIQGALPMVWKDGAIRYAMDLARQREGGRAIMFRFENKAMAEGKSEEPEARRAYMLRSGYMVQTCGVAYTEDGKFAVSPDGLPDGDPDGEDGLVEIKTMVSSENLFRAFIDGDISEFRDQCLMEMWLLHKKWCDLALWAPDMPVPLRVIRIERDEEEIQAFVDDMMEFDRLVESYRLRLRERMAEMADDAALLAIMDEPVDDGPAEAVAPPANAPVDPETGEILSTTAEAPAIAVAPPTAPVAAATVGAEDAIVIVETPQLQIPPNNPAADAAVERFNAAAAPAESVKLGDICAWLGITMTSAFVSGTLGIQPLPASGKAVLFASKHAVRDALVKHLSNLN